MKKFFTHFGQRIINFFEHMGNLSILAGQVLFFVITGKSNFQRTVNQVVYLGLKSLPVVILTALCVGMAFTVQVVREFLKFGAAEIVGGVVGLAFWRELGPLMTGVVICGRVGAAISAELGSMTVTEQVEALESMSQDKVEYLVVPRVLATTLLLPILVGISDIVGFFGGFFVAIGTGRINPYSFFGSAEQMLRVSDITGGLLKGLIFGFVIALFSCYMGLRARGGAKGVGDNTTTAVVVSLILVFVLNYFLSLVVFQ